MEAVRKIMKLSDINPFISLSWKTENMSVEVFIFPIDENKDSKNFIPTPSSMKGALKEYANPDLVEMEKYAWEINLQEKYGNF